jgi:hypothetical protein
MCKHVAPLGYTTLIPLFALGEAANTNFNLTERLYTKHREKLYTKEKKGE